MIAEAIEKLLGLAKVEVLDIGSRKFTTRRVDEIEPKSINGLKVHSLQAVVDFFDGTLGVNCDLDKSDALIQIVDPCTVRIFKGAADAVSRQRELFLEASLLQNEFAFGQWFDQEQMVIALMTLFADGEGVNTDEVIQVVSGIVASQEVKVNDDGLSQEVAVRKGVSRVENVSIKNPIMLAPIRTFTEVDQVVSPHVLRVRCVKELPEVAIYEAGGGAWKNVAVANIKAWLAERIEGVKILG